MDLFRDLNAWLLVFIAAVVNLCIDCTIWPYLTLVVHKIVLAGTYDWMIHGYLFVGHLGASAVSNYLSPLLVAVVPKFWGRAPVDPSDTKEPGELQSFLFLSQTHLQGHMNAEFLAWTTVYSWDVIKSAAHMLIIDQVGSHSAYGRARMQVVDEFQGCTNQVEDRDRKYALLHTMYEWSTFKEVKKRLEQAAKIG